MMPKYLLQVTEWPKPVLLDSVVEPLISWQPCKDEAEADDYIRNANRPGFGQPVTRVEYRKYLIGAVARGTVEVEPITMLEGALDYHEVSGNQQVNVKLYGRYRDGPAVFWTERENSFAIVKPSDLQAVDKRYVSDQGVVLVCVNGIGEIRWTVSRNDAQSRENKEAVDHFELTWSD